MPTYQYECDHCQHTLEVFQSITDPKLKVCPRCQKETLRRLIGTGGGIIFKGSGFYETDYKRNSKDSPAPAAASCPKDPSQTCSCPCGENKG